MPGAAPDWSRTVHCIGDLHMGAITDVRLDAVRRDVDRLGTPALHVQVGDATESGTEVQDRIALAFLNHDVLRNGRSAAAWARAYGRSGHNFSVDLDFARVILIGPDRSEPGGAAGRLSARTLAFLDDQLAQGPENCWIACHWPLFRTVMGDPRLHFTSAMDALPREARPRHPRDPGPPPERTAMALRSHPFAPERSRADQASDTRARPDAPGDQRVGAGRDRKAPRPASAALLPLPDPPPHPDRGALPRPQGSALAEHPR